MYTSIHDCTTDFVGDTSPRPLPLGCNEVCGIRDQKGWIKNQKPGGSKLWDQRSGAKFLLLSGPEAYGMALNRPNTDGKHKKANKGLKVSDIY